MPADEAPKRPEPPTKVDNPLPHLAEGMKKLGEMQVLITKMVDELDLKRQAEYIAAVQAFDKDQGKDKEEADKKAVEIVFNAREVKRLRRKLEQRPCKAEADLHAMGNPKIIARVLQHADFDKANLQAFCVIAKAWVVPCRSLIFSKLSDLQVTTKARCDGLIELFTARPGLCEVVKTLSFAFQPPDPSTGREVALRESLPSPIQFMLILTLCSEAKTLNFTNMATFGATRSILSHIAQRVEKATMDPKGYAWHGKEVVFGVDGRPALFGAWPNLSELNIARVVLHVEDPNSYNNRRDSEDGNRAARCPLTHLSLEKVRLRGRIFHILEGAHNRLTHLSLFTVGSLQLRDLCQTLTEHGASLTNLVIISCQVVDNDTHTDHNEDSAWGGEGGGNTWGSSGQASGRGRLGAFDRALSACVNLVHLSIEPGCLPVYRPSILFRALAKLETLEFNKRDANSYDPSAWMSLLGLGPVLLEQKRKLTKIRFGHDWVGDTRPVKILKENWQKCGEAVEFGRLQ